VTVFRFEDIDADLPLLPLAARRALDVAGRRLSLKAWQRLGAAHRAALVALGSQPSVDTAAVRAAIAGADPPDTSIAADDESRLEAAPASLAIDADHWRALGKLERFALHHLAAKNRPSRLREALAEIAPDATAQAELAPRGLTHLDERGQAVMVDVGAKPATRRRAVAGARVRMKPETARVVATAPKGDVLAAARIAGIMAAKRTPELIPLCHAIHLTRVTIDFALDEARGSVAVTAAAEAEDRTGVEMEAMIAASVAALTIYDMLKGVERGIVIEQVALLEKSGGKSGDYRARAPAEPTK
jgi:cyclic pyranopterin phosphate synthase